MFHFRRSALRILSSPSASFLSKPRTISSFAPSPLRIKPVAQSLYFQRRWATGEAEAKEEEQDVPISEIQATPEEEVENAIQSDNAAETSAVDEPANTFEAAEEAAPAQQESSVTETVTENVAGAATSVSEAVQRATKSITGTSDMSREETIAAPKRTIYIGNLFFDVTENDLVKELSRFGTIHKCRLIRDSRGLSKGFGYIDFENIEAATAAINTLNQQLFEGRRLNVQFAAFETQNLESSRGRQQRPDKPLNPPSKTLFIGNMSFEMTDRDLNSLFRGIRNVIDVRVAIDRRTGQPRGFAHADFIDTKSAMEAMKVLQGKETYGRRLRIDYSYGSSNSPRNQVRDDGESEGAQNNPSSE